MSALKVKSQRRLNDKSLSSIIDTENIWLENSYPTSSSLLLEGTWKNNKRNWGHSLHSMASRSGSFPAALADYFIQRFSAPKQNVLDPFSGKGTTALQACLSERCGIGIDIAPEAYALTAAKTVRVKHDEAVTYLQRIKLSRDRKLVKDVPEEVRIFYHDEVLAQIISFREQLRPDYSLRHVSYMTGSVPVFESQKKTKNALIAQYWMGVMIGILHGSSELSLSVPCSHSFSMSPGYVKNYSLKHGLVKPKRDLLQCLINRSAKLQGDGHNIYEGRALLGSAMELPKSFDKQIDLIVTSPPYFTAQTYAWDNWLREWFLGFDFKEVRTQTLHTSIVDKYRTAMNQHLRESFRVLKKNSWAFIVVGDVIRKTARNCEHVVTAKIIAEEAEKVGFSVKLIINDDIPQASRYNSAFLKDGQGLKLDRIVCLYK